MYRKTDIIDLTKLKPRKNELPLVSVIVPSYNVEEYIDQCLTSILNNGYRNIELLVIDDRSTDGTVDHIRALMKRDKRIQLFHNPEDHNIYGGACRNIGLDHAKGKYVYFCDSDDYILPGLISSCVVRCEKLKAEICCFRHKRLDTCSGAVKDCEESLNLQFLDSPLQNTFKHDSCKNVLCITWSEVWDKFYLKSFIDSINARFQEIKNSNDCSFYVKTMSSADAITYIDECFYIYRTNTQTSVQKDMKNRNSLMVSLLALEQSYEYVRELNNSKLFQDFYEWMYEHLWHIKKLNPIDCNFHAELKKFLSRIGFYNGKMKTLVDSFNDKKSPWDIFDKIVCIHYLPYKDRL